MVSALFCALSAVLALTACGSDDSGSRQAVSDRPVPESGAEDLAAAATDSLSRGQRQADGGSGQLRVEWPALPRNASDAGENPRAEFFFRLKGDGSRDFTLDLNDISPVFENFGESGPSRFDYSADRVLDLNDNAFIFQRFGTELTGFRIYQDQTEDPSSPAGTIDLHAGDARLEFDGAGRVRLSFDPPGGMTGNVKLVPLDGSGEEVPAQASPVLELTRPPRPEQWQVLDREVKSEGPTPYEFHPVGEDRLITFSSVEDSEMESVQLWDTAPEDDVVLDELVFNGAGLGTYSRSRNALFLTTGVGTQTALTKLDLNGGGLEEESLLTVDFTVRALRVPEQGNIAVLREDSGLRGYNMETGEKVWECSQRGANQLDEIQLIPPFEDRVLSIRGRILGGTITREYRVSDGEVVRETDEFADFDKSVFRLWDPETIVAVGRRGDEFENYLQKINHSDFSTRATFPLTSSGDTPHNGVGLLRSHDLVLGGAIGPEAESSVMAVYSYSREKLIHEFAVQARIGGEFKPVPSGREFYFKASSGTEEVSNTITKAGAPD